jgi:hypothetical protein
MRKIFYLTLTLSLFVSNLQAQSFNTKYVSNKNSTFCAEETHEFKFVERKFIHTDTYDGSKLNGPSKKEFSNYDDSGYYYEIRTDKFILEEEGIDGYRRHEHIGHKLLFDKRGGKLLYI